MTLIETQQRFYVLDRRISAIAALVSGKSYEGISWALVGDHVVFGCKITQGFSAADMLLALEGEAAGDGAHYNPFRVAVPTNHGRYPNVAHAYGSIFYSMDVNKTIQQDDALLLGDAPGVATTGRHDIVFVYVGQQGPAVGILEGTATAACYANFQANGLETALYPFWTGAWVTARWYKADEGVSHGGVNYFCILAHTSQEPPNAAYWTVSYDPTNMPVGCMAVARVYVQFGDTGIANARIADIRDFVGRLMSDFNELCEAKGDLAVGLEADEWDNLTVGSDGQVLLADSGETLGLKWDTLFRQNAIIGGSLDVWQGATSFAAIAHATKLRNGFTYLKSGTMVHTAARNTDVPVPSDGLPNYSVFLDCTTADADIAAGDYCQFRHCMEGYIFKHLKGRTATLSFWVKAHKTGIYCVAFHSSNGDRSYIAEYTVNVADTWELKTITLTFNASGGTWDYINGIGLNISWSLACGSTYHGAAGSWLTGAYSATANQVNGVDSVDNDFRIAWIGLFEGAVKTDFAYRPYAQELALRKRYYHEEGGGIAYEAPGIVGVIAATTQADMANRFPVEMRTAPTITFSAAADWLVLCENWYAISNIVASLITTRNCRIDATIAGATAGRAAVLHNNNTTAARIYYDAEL